MTDLSIVGSIIPTMPEGPMLTYHRHSYRKFSFRLAREMPYYFQRGVVPYPWAKSMERSEDWRNAHREREAEYWRTVFDSQLATVRNVDTKTIQTVPCPPDAEQYSIYPAKHWVLVSIEFSRLVIPPGSMDDPVWSSMTNHERKHRGLTTVCELNECKNWFVYPHKPRIPKEDY